MPATATDDTILHTACAQVGLDSSTAAPLHRHATSVWLLPGHGIVVRINRSAADRARISHVVQITRWATDRGIPATEPIDVDQPVETEGASVTFWRYYPQPDQPGPDAAYLGRILRELHALPEPPVPLDDYVPLVRLGEALDRHTDGPLADDEHGWLAERRHALLDAYAELDSELGVGLIHGDAYPGNMLWDGGTARLGDWDEFARGPRELDLVNTHQGVRFGRSRSERQAFTRAYRWDVTIWPGYAVLREMRDLHTLGAYLDRAASGDSAAVAELRHRVATLRAGDTDALWKIR